MSTDSLVRDYLARLEQAAAALPPDRRSELLEEIGEHISSAQPGDEAEVWTLLDRLGPPEEIVAVAREDLPTYGPGPGWGPPVVPQPRGTGQELAAVLMLTAGSFLPVIGWVVGVVLLWTSSLWRVREKLLGTLVVPLGPGGVLVLGALLPLAAGGEVCTSTGSVELLPGGQGAPPPLDPPFPGGDGSVTCTTTGSTLPAGVGWVLLSVMLLAPVLVAVLLMRRARRRAAEQPVLVPAYGPASRSPWGGLEIAAVLVLGLGGLVIPVVGSLIGLGLALASSRWTRRDKLVASALGLAPVLGLVGLFVLRSTGGGLL